MREALAAFFSMIRTLFIAGNEGANALHTSMKAVNKLAQVGESMADSLHEEALQERELNKQRFLVKLETAKKEDSAEAETLQLAL